MIKSQCRQNPTLVHHQKNNAGQLLIISPLSLTLLGTPPFTGRYHFVWYNGEEYLGRR